jgi:MFS family permease
MTAGLVAMITAVGFEGLAVPTVLPDTLDDLGGLALYGWAFSGFWLANLVGITLAGSESDRRGPLRPFVAGTASFALGLLVAALAPNMATVVAGRVIQGLGAGAIGAVTYVLIARGYDPPARPRMIAIISSAWVVPGLVGPGLAAVVSEQLSWRWVLGGLAPLLPLVAAVVVVSMRRLPPLPETLAGAGRAGRDIRDSLLLAIGAGLALGAATLGASWLAVPMAAAGIGLAAVALPRLLPAGSLTASSGRGATVAGVALISVAFLGAEAFVPLAVSSVRGAGLVAGGLSLTAAALTWSIGSWVQARWAATGARRLPVAAGFGLVLVGILIEALVPLTSLPIWLAPLGWAIGGLGMGIGYSMLALVTLETAPEGGEGAASAAMQLAEALGIAAGTGAAGAVISVMALGPGLAPGIGLADLLLACVAGVGVLLAVRIPEAGRRPAASQAVVEALDATLGKD